MTTVTELETHTQKALDLIAGVRRPGLRTVIGIAGPPGSGKSTLAATVVRQLNSGDPGQGIAALLPMDGFHLDNDELDTRGLRAVKGAPETFDAAGFVDLVRCLKDARADITYPLFDREHDRTVPDAGRLPAETPVVVVEGNYLLLKSGAWAALKPLFDATVMIAPPLRVLESRLIERWLEHGLSRDAAVRRARENDLRNARYVLQHSADADLGLTDKAEVGAANPEKE